MKKKMLSLALVLALCLGLIVPAVAADASGLDSNAKKAYYDILTAEIGKYGVVSRSGGSGLEYAALEDMDANGTPELIVIRYADEGTANINIWTMWNGNAVQTVNEETSAGGALSEANIFFVRKPGQMAVCYSFEWYDRISYEGTERERFSFQLYYVDGTTKTISADTVPDTEMPKAVLDREWTSDYNTVFHGGFSEWLHDDKAAETVEQVQHALLPQAIGDNTAPAFTDVKTSDYFAGAVAWAVNGGVTVGTNDGTTFSPKQICTEVEILTMLHRAAGKPDAAPSPLTVASWYQDAVDWAYEEGMIDQSFKPDAPCTRASTVKYIWQAFGSKSAPASGFTDVFANAGYAAAVDWAVENGITGGTDTAKNTFSPDRTCMREEIVTFLHRAYVPEVRLANNA